MVALPAEVYTACVIGKAKAELRSLGYGRNATAEINLQIADSTTKAALRHCKPLYPKHLEELEEEALGYQAPKAKGCLQSRAQAAAGQGTFQSSGSGNADHRASVAG